MDKRSRERHQQHSLVLADVTHIDHVTPINARYRLHECLDCDWRGWVQPWEEEAA